VLDVLKFWDYKLLNNLNNLVVLEGDITKKKLSLNKKTLDVLNNEIDEIYHCAAATKFNMSLEELRRVNVEGFKNLLEIGFNWCKKEKLKKVNYISTAYICGDHNGKFKEDDLDLGQKFNTFYEQSKFEAEKLVNNFRSSGMWIDVFRPPMVIGETTTGKVLSFNQAFYQAIHLLSLGILSFIPCLSMLLNLVYLDELCNSVFCISANSHVKNKNYHVSSSKLFSAEQFLNFFYKFLGLKKPKFIYPDIFIKEATPVEKELLKYNFLFLNRKTEFDSMFTNKLLKKYGFVFSEYDEKKLSKILEYAIKRKFINKIRYD